jgi:long-chain acyl-CoA synthetase
MSVFRTLNELFLASIERDLRRVMMFRDNTGWRDISSRDLYQRVLRTARALESWGIKKGERVAILSENRSEWAITDFACLGTGIVDVPIYATLTAEQTAFILRDSGARVIFLSTVEQLKKVQQIRHETQIEKIVVMDQTGEADVLHMSTIMHEGVTESPSQWRDAAFDAQLQAITPEDLATIIYTSGTTGTSKGVMLTHGNIASNLTYSVEAFRWSPDKVLISFLPLSHITARHLDYACFQYGVTLAYCPQFDQLPRMLQEIRPHIFVAVPRVYEKIRQEVQRKTSSGIKRELFAWSLRKGREHRTEILAGQTPKSLKWKLADRLVFSKIRHAFGGRVMVFISGGAPLGMDLGQWFADAGIRIFEGYGLTETSPVIALNNVRDYKLGTVGKPLPNVECRIAADGELLVRGSSIFKSYWQNPQETERAFEGEWFKTGDIGEIDADGFLKITDRKKDLLKTSGGKFIAPQPIENRLKDNVLIAHASVIGDRRKFASVIIAPHFPMLEDWAQVNQVPFKSRGELVSHPRVRTLYEGMINELNKELAQFEKLKKILIVPDEFSIATGEITPTLKLKRRVVEAKYKEQIDALYAEGSPIPESAIVS